MDLDLVRYVLKNCILDRPQGKSSLLLSSGSLQLIVEIIAELIAETIAKIIAEIITELIAKIRAENYS